REFNRQRQPDVAETNDPDRGAAILYSFQQDVFHRPIARRRSGWHQQPHRADCARVLDKWAETAPLSTLAPTPGNCPPDIRGRRSTAEGARAADNRWPFRSVCPSGTLADRRA